MLFAIDAWVFVLCCLSFVIAGCLLLVVCSVSVAPCCVRCVDLSCVCGLRFVVRYVLFAYCRVLVAAWYLVFVLLCSFVLGYLYCLVLIVACWLLSVAGRVLLAVC